MCIRIVIFVAVFLSFHTASSLLCADNSAKGFTNCSNGDVCFRHEDTITKQVTKGCSSPAVCENIRDGSKCITCEIDVCNSGSNRIYVSVIFPVIFIACNILFNS